MNPYAKGAKLERRAMHILEEDGYTCTRSAGSHGPWDIVGFRGVEPARIIQVKSNISEAAAMRELKKLRAHFHTFAPVTVELWVFEDGNTEPYIY